MNKSLFITLGVITSIALGFYVYFFHITESYYRVTPVGDAASYNIMTLYFGNPSKIEPIQPVFSSRIVSPFINYVLARKNINNNRQLVSSIKEVGDFSTSRKLIRFNANRSQLYTIIAQNRDLEFYGFIIYEKRSGKIRSDFIEVKSSLKQDFKIRDQNTKEEEHLYNSQIYNAEKVLLKNLAAKFLGAGAEIREIELPLDATLADHIEKFKNISTAISANQLTVNWAFVSIFIAYLLTLIFLFLTMSHLGIEKKVAYTMLIIYSMLFVSLRLYIMETFLVDPWAFAFLIMAIYFMVSKKDIPFLIFSVLGVMTKENLLFLLPIFFLYQLRDNLSKKRLIVKALITSVPLLVWLSFKIFPYFPVDISVGDKIYPNIPSVLDTSKPITTCLKCLPKYLKLFKYHFTGAAQSFLFYFDYIFIPSGVFGALLFFLIFHIKSVVDIFKKNLPISIYSIIITFLFIGSERQIIYIFPGIILLSSSILMDRYSNNRNLVMLFLITITFLLQEVFISTGASRINLQYKHLIFMSNLFRDVENSEAARSFKYLISIYAAVSFLGFYIIQKWGDKIKTRVANIIKMIGLLGVNE